MPAYLAYAPALEQPSPDEHIIFDEISRTMQHITRTMAARYRHAYRPVHAKSHGVLTVTLEVLPSLAPEFAQGLFVQPASYPVILRFSYQSRRPARGQCLKPARSGGKGA